MSLFKKKLAEISTKNGFTIACDSDEPEVVLIGDYHPGNMQWFSDNIEDILINSVEKNDTILMEGAEGKIIPEYFSILDSPVFQIMNELKERKVSLFFNDSQRLLEQQMTVRNSLRESFRQGLEEENKKANEVNLRLMNKRNANFVHGPYGIKKHSQRKYQIVGLSHLSQIQKILEEEKISYATLVPTLPKEVDSYFSACLVAQSGSIEEKVAAIQKISHVPIRNSRNLLKKALDENSTRVRKYAAFGLGKMPHKDSLTFLLSQTNGQDELVDWAIYRSLAKFADEKIKECTLNLLRSRKRRDWNHVAILLRNPVNFAQEQIQEQLGKGLKSNDPYLQALAVNLLGKTKYEPQMISSYTHDRHPAVREEAKKLMNLEGENTLPILFRPDSDKVFGSLYGVFIGDALGAPVESFSLEKIKLKFGMITKYEIQERKELIRPAGSYTDDGEMTLEILKSLSSRKKFEPSDLASRFGMIAESIDDDFSHNKGYSRQTLAALRKLSVGVNWHFTGSNSTGCGAAMRVAPFAALEESIENKVWMYDTQSKITHQNPVARAAAVAIGTAVDLAYSLDRNFDKEHFISEIAQSTVSLSPELAQEISNLKSSYLRPPSEVLGTFPTNKSSKPGCGAMGTVPLALYSFLRTPEDFRETIITAVNHSGDSDSVAAMAGAISGAFNGLSKIPSYYLDNLYEKKQIDAVLSVIYR